MIGPSKEFTTFMPLLIRAVSETRGTVLELGSGPSSTPLLHWLCFNNKRPLWTYEDDDQYFEYARKFRSGNHHVRKVLNWTDVIFPESDVALIDQNSMRAETAIMLKDKVKYVILHDSEHPEKYGYEKVWPHYKYAFTWKECRPWTTVISNSDTLASFV